MRNLKFIEMLYGEDNNNIRIENDVLGKIDLSITGHFNNCVSLNLITDKGRELIPMYNSTKRIGFILKALVEMLDICQDDPMTISSIKNIPIRLVYKDDIIVAIGHHKKDRFELISELMEAGPKR